MPVGDIHRCTRARLRHAPAYECKVPRAGVEPATVAYLKSRACRRTYVLIRGVASPKAIGETTEAVILAHLIQRGDSVSLPFGNNQRYDMIIDRRGKLIKAQCKTGRLRKGVVTFKVSSCNGFTGEHRDYKGQVDVFLVWCPELKTVYEVPVADCGRQRMSLRIERAKNGQLAYVRYAANYVVPAAGVEPASSLYESAALSVELGGPTFHGNAHL